MYPENSRNIILHLGCFLSKIMRLVIVFIVISTVDLPAQNITLKSSEGWLIYSHGDETGYRYGLPASRSNGTGSVTGVQLTAVKHGVRRSSFYNRRQILRTGCRSVIPVS
jgi:hypothetical protein